MKFDADFESVENEQNFIKKSSLQKPYESMHFFHFYSCSLICFAYNFYCVNFVS